MSESFTPAPWHVSEDELPGMEWNRHISTDPSGEHRICFMAHNGAENDDEFLANARLIAAAPDLYAALMQVLPALKTEWPKAYSDAMRALAKARGEEIVSCLSG